MCCHIQVASLLALGADRTIVDKRGRTPEGSAVDPLVKGIFAEDTKKVSLISSDDHLLIRSHGECYLLKDSSPFSTTSHSMRSVPLKSPFIAGSMYVVQRAREVTYTHADGTSEIVDVVKKHSEAEGGGYTIFVPSLGRERQTVDHRLSFGPGSMYYTAPKEPSEKAAGGGADSNSAAGQSGPAPPSSVSPPPPLSPPSGD